MRDTRRQFSSLQKDKLFILYEGRCGICSELLGDDWEADHIQPWSLDGPTIVKNGQPACKLCNKRKGSFFMQAEMQARTWQEDFLENYRKFGKEKNYLLVATPGAGKTYAAIRAAKSLLATDEISKIIVVCPTRVLKKQWADKAHDDLGIELGHRDLSSLYKPKYHGVCVTYGKIAAKDGEGELDTVDTLNVFCETNRTLVIFDELHHAGHEKAWGEALLEAFKNAVRTLGLSGTLFRSDGNRIPFVTYDDDGKACPNFSFTYVDAIKKQEGDVYPVCRMLMFSTFDGGARWLLNQNEHQQDSFISTDPDEQKRYNSTQLELLKALLVDVRGNYLTAMFKDADNRLSELRETELLNSEEKKAGGLVVCMTIVHADSVATRFNELFGERPLVVHSDQEDAKERIVEFANSNDRWIIAVKMVSEGVDIPRLRVGIYITNVTQRLTFLQIMGRVIRRRNAYDEWAYFYVPRAPLLEEIMTQIRANLLHQLKEDIKSTLLKCEECARTNITKQWEDDVCYCTCRDCDNKWEIRSNPRDADVFHVLDTDHNSTDDAVIANEILYDKQDALYFQSLLRDKGQAEFENEWEARDLVTQLFKRWEERKETVVTRERKTTQDIPIYQEEEILRNECHKLAKLSASRMEASQLTDKTFTDLAREIHHEWHSRPGNHRQGDADIDELRRKKAWLLSREVERRYFETHGRNQQTGFSGSTT